MSNKKEKQIEKEKEKKESNEQEREKWHRKKKRRNPYNREKFQRQTTSLKKDQKKGAQGSETTICTKCRKCACGRFWIKSSDHFRVSWWGSGPACSAWTLSLFWWKVCGKQTSGERSCLLSPWMWRVRLTRWERENLELRARPCLGFTKSASFSLDVGMRQGGPRTPSGWNQVMAVLVEELLRLWAGRAPAVSWAQNGCRLKFLAWADNIFLVSSSIIDIVQRTQEIAEVFGKRGLRFNQSSLEILPSKTAEREVTRVLLNEEMEFSWVRILVVLGCYLDGSGSTETQVKGRLENCALCCVVRGFLRKSASKRFTPRWLQVFCGIRVAGFRRQKPSNSSQSRKPGGSRCMLGDRKAQDVPWVDWFRTTARSAQALRCRLNLPSLWHRALAAVCGWAGHVARKDPSHPGHATIQWRNAEWWEIMKSTGAGSPDQTWRHRRRNWVRNFEHVLSRILGLDWWAVRWWLGRKAFLENLAPIVDAGFTWLKPNWIR